MKSELGKIEKTDRGFQIIHFKDLYNQDCELQLSPLAKESSQIAATGFHEPSNTLVVKFHTGAIYCYDHCDVKLHDDMRNADSVGKFFNRHIKSCPDKYPYRKIADANKEIK